MEPAREDASRLLGSAVRPLLITVILRLRPEYDPIAVGWAVERIALSGEELQDSALMWSELERALSELQRFKPE
jgi:hypothetical protein